MFLEDPWIAEICSKNRMSNFLTFLWCLRGMNARFSASEQRIWQNPEMKDFFRRSESHYRGEFPFLGSQGWNIKYFPRRPHWFLDFYWFLLQFPWLTPSWYWYPCFSFESFLRLQVWVILLGAYLRHRNLGLNETQRLVFLYPHLVWIQLRLFT
jgi:hypothetical protein